MFWRRKDLPLDRDLTSRFLPWIVAPMVFLMGLSVLGAFSLDGAITRWQQGLGDRLTVWLPAPEAMADGDADGKAAEAAADSQKRLERTLEIVLATPGVGQAVVMPFEDKAALLEPWLGPVSGLKDLPVPEIIDVTLADDSAVDYTALAARLANETGAVVERPGAWLDRLARAAQAVQLAAIMIAALTAAATVATVAFSVKVGLAVHRETVDILHLMGANDRYIARQFQIQGGWLGLIGGVIGAGGAALAFVLVPLFTTDMTTNLLPRLTPGLFGWMAIVALPLATAVLALITARVTVLRRLARLA